MLERILDKDALQELSKIFSEISDEKDMLNFLREIFTEKECFDLALRWRLLKAIYTGDSQRKIAKDHGISLCKITRGSKILKKEGSYTKKLLDEYYGRET